MLHIKGTKFLYGAFMALVLATWLDSTATTLDVCDEQYSAREETSSWFSRSTVASRVLDIGTALTLDPSTKHGDMGQLLRHAYTFYFDWLNNNYGGLTVGGEKYWIRLHLLDDKSDSDRVANITRHLVHEKKILHFLGPYGSTLVNSAAMVLNETRAVMVCGCAASPRVFIDRPNMFGVLPKTNTFLENVFPLLKLRGVESVGYIYEEAAFTRGVCSAADRLADENLMRLTFKAGFTFTSDGKIVRDVLYNMSYNFPEVLIGCVYSYACEQILEAAAEMNYNPLAIVLTVCVTTDSYREISADLGGYVMGVAPWTREMHLTSELTGWKVSEFVQEFERTYGGRIAYQAVASFASAAALMHAIQRAGTVTDPDKVAQVLRSMDHKSVFGQISFDENGQGKVPIQVVQAQDMNTPIVAPAELAYNARLVFPKPSFSMMPCLNSNKFVVGQYGVDPHTLECVMCKETEYAPFNASLQTDFAPLGHRVCKKLMCPAGSRSVIFQASENASGTGGGRGGAFCLPCLSGYFSAESGATQCEACAVGKYQQMIGGTNCIDCIPGKHSPSLGAVSCQACNQGRFSSLAGASRCRNCPHGSYCNETSLGIISDYTNANGFFMWNDSLGERILLKCQHGEDGNACVLGGKCRVDSDTGEESMEGPFCGKCRDGYGWSGANGICEQCPSNSVAFLLVGLQILGVLFVVTFIYCMVLYSDLTKPKNLNAVIVKQMFNYVNMIIVVFQATDLRIPVEFGIVSDILVEIKVFCTASVPAFIARAGHCLLAQIGPPVQMQVIIGLTWIPVWSICLNLCFWIFHSIQKMRGVKPPRRSRLLTLLIVNLFVIQPLNTDLCLSVFRCKHFDTSRLMRDTTVECTSAEHFFWQMLGMLGFVLYSLGYPFGTYLLLRHYKKKGKLTKRKTMNTLGFLYCGFEPQCYYFECLFMLRKVLFQLVVFLPYLSAEFDQDDRTIKCASLLFLAVLFLALHLAFEPYDNRSYFALDRIEASMLWAVLLTLQVQTWLFVSDKSYVFDAVANGDQDSTKSARRLRDGIGTVIVLICHIRVFFMTLFHFLRSTLLRSASRIVKWKIFSCGFVGVRSDALVLYHADGVGRKLFTTMYQELAELLIEHRNRINYDEFTTSLQYMTLKTLFFQKRDLFQQEWDDDDDEEMHKAVSQSLQRTPFRKFLRRIKAHLGMNVRSACLIEDTPKSGNFEIDSQHFEIKGSTRTVVASIKVALAELERLQIFTEESKKDTYGKRFTIEELHMSLVRLHRDIGSGVPTLQAIASSGSRQSSRGSVLRASLKPGASFASASCALQEASDFSVGRDVDCDDDCLTGKRQYEKTEEEVIEELVGKCEDLDERIRETNQFYVNLLEEHKKEKRAFERKRINLMNELRRHSRNIANVKVGKRGSDDMTEPGDGEDGDVVNALRRISVLSVPIAGSPCIQCGELLVSGDRFCTVCGNAADEDDVGESKEVAVENRSEFEDRVQELIRDDIVLEDEIFHLKCRLQKIANDTREKANMLELARAQLAALSAETNASELSADSVAPARSHLTSKSIVVL